MSQFQEPIKPSVKPIGDAATPAGYAAPASSQSSLDQGELQAIAQKAATVLNDPLQLYRLTERVYELLVEDFRQQQDRSGNYGSWWR